MPLIIWGRKEKRSNIDTITITGISFENKTNVLKQKNPLYKNMHRELVWPLNIGKEKHHGVRNLAL